MKDIHLERLSKVLIWGLKKARVSLGGEFQPGDIIQVLAKPQGLCLVEFLYADLLRERFNVDIRLGMTPKMELDFYNLSTDEQLEFLMPWSQLRAENIRGSINVYATTSLTHLKDVSSEKFNKAIKSHRVLKNIKEVLESQGKYSWTLCLLPTQALADQARMSLDKYTEQVVRACFLDEVKPVEAWENIYRESFNMRKKLNSLNIESVRVISENTNLNIEIGKQRKWCGGDGFNIPSFEIFTSPDCRFSEGVYYADMPSFMRGNYVEGVRLVFQGGKVVEASATKGEEFLKKMVAMDKGSCQIGEFSLTDKRRTRITEFMANTLYDENTSGPQEQGNCHIAIGSSYQKTFSGDIKSLNKEKKKELGLNSSCLHWDLVNTEPKEVVAKLRNGKRLVLYSNGEFQI